MEEHQWPANTPDLHSFGMNRNADYTPRLHTSSIPDFTNALCSERAKIPTATFQKSHKTFKEQCRLLKQQREWAVRQARATELLSYGSLVNIVMLLSSKI